MAAHVKMALEQIKSGQTRDMAFHLGHAPWADQLELEDWAMFMNIATTENDELIKKFAGYLLPKYSDLWRMLEYPDSLEDWLSKLRQDNA